MKILMFGRGVISTLYGWSLAKAGHEVEYYVRPHRITEFGTSVQVEIHDARAKGSHKIVTENLSTKLIDNINKDNDYDLIIISVSHHNFAEVAKFLAPKIGNATVLIFNNFWQEPQQLASPFPNEQIIWGFPQAGGGFPNGKLRGLLAKNVMFGNFGEPITQRGRMARKIFEQAGFNITEQGDFRGWLFVHFIVNGAMHTEQLLAGGAVNLFQSARHRKNVILNMRELIPLVEARDVNLELHKSEIMMARLPTWIGSSILGLAWKFYKPLKMMAESHDNPQDILTTCQVLLDDAKARNIPTPRLEAAVRQVEES